MTKMIIKAIINAFKSNKTPSPPQSNYDLDRHLVSKFADGNVSLQLGRYATEDEISNRLEKVNKHKYTR